MSRFTADARINNYPNHSEKAIYVKSFNEKSTISKDTKFLIVGTLTSVGGRGPNNNGYFYCAKENKMYEFIDKALGTKLCEEKTKFIKDWNQKFKGNIETELKSKKLAFLDVVDEAYVKEGSSRDDDIECYTLATSYFEKIINIDNLKIVANSLNAYCVLLKIFEKIGIKNKNVEIIPQQLRGYSKPNGSGKIYRCIDELEKEWKRFLNSK